MSIETSCPSCSHLLRVADEHAGKQARCPLCHEIYTVPGVSAAAAPSGADTTQWRMRTPEGQTYGPVDRRELDRWVSEGRVTAECMLSSDDQPTWRPADTVFSVLAATAPRERTSSVSPPRTRYVAPHRGGLILALGIISWAVGCPVFGICAWVMGSNDLREMQAGRMDTRGMGLTQAGQVIGMIHAILCIIMIVIAVFAMLVFGLS